MIVQKKLINRFLILGTLFGCLIFSMVSGSNSVSAFDYPCDDAFRPCWNACSSNDSVCFSTCSEEYVNCLFTHPRNVPTKPIDECHSEIIYRNCTRGIMDPQYRDDFNSCLASGQDSLDCCDRVQYEYQINYCY